MKEKLRRWTFIVEEVLKNLAMGIGPIRAHRGSRTRRRIRADVLGAFIAMRDFYLQHLGRLGADDGWLRGKRVLEVGPGESLVIPFWFLAQGASQAAGLDRYMELSPPGAQANVYAMAAETLKPEERARVADLLPWTPLDKPGGRLAYFVTPIEKAPSDLDGCFDLVVSYNALTCVYDVGATMSSLYRLLAPGGKMIHRIPCGSAGAIVAFGAGPLNQLTFSRRVWELMFSNRMSTNRQPTSIYVNQCQAAGFQGIRVEIIDTFTDEELDRLFPMLHHDFQNRSREDLKAYCFALSAVK